MNNILFYLLLTLLAIGAGYALLALSMKSLLDAPFPLRVGSSYFVGLAFYIALVRTLSAMFGNGAWAVWSVIACCIGLCLASRRLVWSLAKECLLNKEVLYVLAAALAFAPLLLIFWLPQGAGTSDPYAMIGSLHSVRYAWVANFISTCGVFPVLGQNTGQSLLAYMGGAIFSPQPYWFLFLWLLSSIVFLAVFLHGFIRLYESRGALILCGVFLIMFGGSALSLTHVMIIDSGSPLALNGYTDSLLGVFSILMLLLVHAELQRRSSGKYFLLPIVVLICVTNFFTAPQNMLYVAAVIPLFAFNFVITRRSGSDFIFWFFAVLLATLIAVPQGGMLTPKSMQSAANVPGLMTTASSGEKNKTGVNIAPGVPFVYGWGGTWKSGQGLFYPEMKANLENWRANLIPILWIFEQLFFTSLRVLFFTILGLIGFFVLLRNKGTAALPKIGIAVPSYRTLGILGAYTFSIGFIINFTISLNGYKWELSRFMIPGVLLGMLGFALCTLSYIAKRSRSALQLSAAICLLVTCGPLVNFIATTAKNAPGLINSVAISDRLHVFNGPGPQIDRGYCSALTQPHR